MENTSDNQEKEKKTRVGRKKLVVTVIGVGAVLVAAGYAGTPHSPAVRYKGYRYRIPS